jgi:hypothetical protein
MKKPSAKEIREAKTAVSKAEIVLRNAEREQREQRADERDEAVRRLGILTLPPSMLAQLVAARDFSRPPRRPSESIVRKLSRLGLVTCAYDHWAMRPRDWLKITPAGLELLKERGL